MELDVVLQVIDRYTSRRPLGFLGEKGVKVLTLNLDLDEIGHDGGQ